ncbi:LysR family transcriptional regulator [Chelativorans salis]|uniref:LysR family transcriptional regulator n=1 Tax=Chelativorans salis TaxID=2978478 RepID=A0ABT2LUC8_9HYPH|nr:LysR family transcriptional regulator [Chelativorans sp. EGI FJ00035]MCT7378135.1 LysR family transcriptional regulator [Chelativorans sp. EGI FJ00035]
MDMRALRYFVSVADNRSFSKAALQLRIGQPALSRSVKQLEQDLGARLFDRSRNGIEMTRSGRLLRRRAKDILDQFSQIQHEVRSQVDVVAGNATVGVPAAAGQLLVPALLAYLADRHPGIRIRTIEGISAENHDRLLSQTVHVCLLYDPLPHRDLQLTPVAVEDMHLVARREMLSLLGDPCALSELENLPLILPSSPNSRRLLVEKAFKDQNLVLNVQAEVDSFVVTRTLLMAGKGYSLTTLSSIADLPEDSPLSYAQLDPDKISWVLSMAIRTANLRNPVLQAVSDALVTVTRRLIESGAWQGARVPR